MKNEKTKEPKKNKIDDNIHQGCGLAARDARYKSVLKSTRNPRAAVRAYASGNVYAEENARAVGNW
jgi:hypothetical protein